MKILLTGASSFTGLWFARALAEAGHAVTAALRRPVAADAGGVRGERVRRLARLLRVVESAEFGGEQFIALVRDGGFAVLCHHAARVADYRSRDFDVAQALAENTRQLATVLRAGMAGGLGAVVLTGSVFEPDEGAGDEPRRAFSPYALSKAATAAVFRFWCQELGLKLAKFVIPNPFGPFEEKRFCDFLLRRWAAGEAASVRTPLYVRDNIPVSLLARAYCDVLGALPSLPDYSHHAPSFYVETQGAFAQRFAGEIGRRLGLPCRLELPEQTDFSEPMVRINTARCDPARLGWDEAAAWDELAAYYRGVHLRGPARSIA